MDSLFASALASGCSFPAVFLQKTTRSILCISLLPYLGRFFLSGLFSFFLFFFNKLCFRKMLYGPLSTLDYGCSPSLSVNCLSFILMGLSRSSPLILRIRGLEECPRLFSFDRHHSVLLMLSSSSFWRHPPPTPVAP